MWISGLDCQQKISITFLGTRKSRSLSTKSKALPLSFHTDLPNEGHVSFTLPVSTTFIIWLFYIFMTSSPIYIFPCPAHVSVARPTSIPIPTCLRDGVIIWAQRPVSFNRVHLRPIPFPSSPCVHVLRVSDKKNFLSKWLQKMSLGCVSQIQV